MNSATTFTLSLVISAFLFFSKFFKILGCSIQLGEISKIFELKELTNCVKTADFRPIIIPGFVQNCPDPRVIDFA